MKKLFVSGDKDSSQVENSKNFDLLTDIDEIKPRLSYHIQKFGYRPEHHLYLYLYNIDPGLKLVYFDFGERGGIVGLQQKKVLYIQDEPISPFDSQIDIFLDTIECIFSQTKTKKVMIEEWTASLRQRCEKELSSRSYEVAEPHETQYCPLINLDLIDENLAGGEFKGFRYAYNRFLKNYKIEFIDATKAPTDSLLKLIKAWGKHREAKDKVWAPDYKLFIENGFPGCNIKRALFVDDVLRGLSVGWRIANSDDYYIYMDIHDYSDEYLGEFISIDHILEAKKLGCKMLDFGASDKSLLNFKMKFHPEKIYEVYNFLVEKAK